jgi:hypothetical protein
MSDFIAQIEAKLHKVECHDDRVDLPFRTVRELVAGYRLWLQASDHIERITPAIRAAALEECRDSIMTAIPLPHPDDQSSDRGRRIGMQDAAMIVAREAAAARALKDTP